MEKAPEKRLRTHVAQEWISAFDREMIRAARDRISVTIELIDLEEAVVAHVIQVDRDFIKFEIAGEKPWYNRQMICTIRLNEREQLEIEQT